MVLISVETLNRRTNAQSALSIMKQMYKKFCPKGNRALLENHITHSTDDQSFVVTLEMIIKDGFPDKRLQDFLDQYTSYRNNAVALPLSQLPHDYQPDFEMKYYEINDIGDKEHWEEFYGEYKIKFTDQEHKTYQRTTKYYEQGLHQQAFEEFSKLLPKHQGFIRVRFNRIVNGLMSLSSKGGRYNEIFRIANGYSKSNRITKKLIKSYNPEQIWNDTELLRELLKEYKDLKKEFPTYEMRRRNRGLQSSMKNFYDLLREVSYECMITKIGRNLEINFDI